MGSRYIVVFGACLTQFAVIGILFSYGLFFKVFEVEFGWSRTLMSSCSAVAFLAMGIFAPLGGRLNDRFGPRLVLGISGAAYGIAFIQLAWMTEPWHMFLIFGTLVGIGLSTHDIVTLSTIARWFQRCRGIMTGVVKVGTATGQIVVPPLAGPSDH